jgi:hypothetical protein
MRIEHQAIDENLSLGELDRSDFNIQTGAYLIENTIDAPSENPADAGNKQFFPCGPKCKDHQKKK